MVTDQLYRKCILKYMYFKALVKVAALLYMFTYNILYFIKYF